MGWVFTAKFNLGKKKTKASMVTVFVVTEASSCSQCHVVLEVTEFGGNVDGSEGQLVSWGSNKAQQREP